MATPYKGQPRAADGRFGRGKQSGSKARNRNIGATANRQVAGLWGMPPVNAPKPQHRPGEGRIDSG